MLQRIMHVFLGSLCFALLSVSNVWAVTFGQIDIASHMGEPFYAEVPLRLDVDENLSKTSVELGTISDYRILEVYRDAAINKMRVDIVEDERGSRVALSSDAAIGTAFFNLVLKVRYGRSTHYKKMPVFLDMAGVGSISKQKRRPVAERIPAINSATVVPETSNAFIAKAPEDLMNPMEGTQEVLDEILVVAEEKKPEPNVFNPYDEWARSARYGPMVYGDTITTVAKRLRLDKRFSNQQVMVALYEKNRDQFKSDNINLIKAGTYLDVPSAQEVGRITAAQAASVLSGHSKAWKSMVAEPKYAAIAEAQRTRYTRRVRVGQQATGTASAPMPAPISSKKLKKAEAVKKKEPAKKAAAEVVKKPTIKVDEASNAQLAKTKAAALQAKLGFEKSLSDKDVQLSAMQQKLAAMGRKIAEAEKKAVEAAKYESNVAPKSIAVSPDAAAVDAQNKRLEIAISRLQSQLDNAKKQTNLDQGSSDWMLYAVAGLGVLVILLLIGVAMLMRKERPHPSDKDPDAQPLVDVEDVVEDDYGYDDIAEAPDDAIENLDAETFDEDDVATKLMNADDFEMPFDASFDDDSPIVAADDLNIMDDSIDAPAEKMPDLTDDDTKEMDPFNADEGEAADPTVNYLEEADVYLRYGMEDEAEKQVHLALKLKADDPLAHAKMVQVQRVKADEDGENRAISAAKAVLFGAALLEFEGALDGDQPVTSGEPSGESADAMVATADDMVPFSSSPMDPVSDDTGAIDFGDFSLTPGENPDVSPDTGEVDFGELDMSGGSEDINAGETDTNDSVDFGGLDFGSLVEDDGSTAEPEDVSSEEITFGDEADGEMGLDFSAMELNAEDDSGSEQGDVSDDSVVLEGLDFDIADDNVASDNQPPVDDDIGMDSLDFGDLDMPSLDASDDLESVDDAQSIDDIVASDDASPVDDGSIGLDSLDFGDLDMLSMDEGDDLSDAASIDDAVAEEVLDSPLESEEIESLVIDFSEIDAEIDANDTIISDAAVLADDNGNDDEFGISMDFDEFDMDSTTAIAVGDETMVVSSENADLNSENILNDRQVEAAERLAEEEANAVSVDVDAGAEDPFAVANALLMDAKSDTLADDLDADSFGSLLGEDIDELSLSEAVDGRQSASVSGDLPDVDIDLTSVTDELMSSLEMDMDELDVAMDAQAVALSGNSPAGAIQEDASGELVSSLEMGMDDLDLEITEPDEMMDEFETGELLENMHVELGDLAYGENDVHPDADVQNSDLENELLSSLELDMENINKAADIDVDTELAEDVARKEMAKIAVASQSGIDPMEADDLSLVSSFEHDLSALESIEGNDAEDLLSMDASPAIEDDFGLNDFDMADLDVVDLDASEAAGDIALHPVMGSSNDGVDLDATVVLHNMTKELKSIIDDEPAAGLLAMDDGSNPMIEDFSATEELDDLQDNLGSLGEDSAISDEPFMDGDFLNEVTDDPMSVDFDATLELNNLMGELDGLLDEEDEKK